MLHLIKLEMRKLQLKAIFLTVFIMNVSIFGIVLLVNSDSSGFKSFEELIVFVETLVGMSFIIYTSVLLSKIFIEEFRQQTISVLFMYPIHRLKLLLAKLIIVITFTFTFISGSSLIIIGSYHFLSENLSFIHTLPTLSTDQLGDKLLYLITFSVACSGLSLIPLFFGMMKKSVPATIVSSIFVILLLDTDEGQTSLDISILVCLGVVGFLMAYWTLQRAVKADL